ncbi:hypothetical protein ACJJTC_008221 [Scirpophaga incertulas]
MRVMRQPSKRNTRKQLTRPAQATGVHAHTHRYTVRCHSKETIFDLAPVACAGSKNCAGLFPHTFRSTCAGTTAPVPCGGSFVAELVEECEGDVRSSFTGWRLVQPRATVSSLFGAKGMPALARNRTRVYFLAPVTSARVSRCLRAYFSDSYVAASRWHAAHAVK